MGKRVGWFFFLVGLLVMFVFFASSVNRTPEFNLFLLGMASVLLGGYLIIRNRKRTHEAERFKRVKKIFKKK